MKPGFHTMQVGYLSANSFAPEEEQITLTPEQKRAERLHNAAPDLLAALKDVIGLAERGAKAGGDPEMTDLWMRGQIAYARAAIAKAEG